MKTIQKISLASLGILLAVASCVATSKGPPVTPESVDAWETIYAVLQHPRCMNCHPSDGIPKQGDAKQPHAQNVRGGADGHGRFALRCESCHRSFNLDGAHLPPGAPNWHMPASEMPLIFEGRSSGDLCRQLKDPERNGNKSLEQLLEHMSSDPLVMWGWSPGVGRTPVPINHADFVAAVKTWIDGGCGCPK